MQRIKWYRVNFNPWQKNIDDCAIRAVSAATGLNYKEVCKKFKIKYKNGYGIVRQTGVDIDYIHSIFNEYFDVVEDYYENNMFIPDEMSQEDIDLIGALDDGSLASGMTLNDFIDMFEGQGVFLVGLQENLKAKSENARHGGHIVCANLNKSNRTPCFYDTWNSGEMLVDMYMRVKRREPKDSPKHYKYDKATHRIVI